MSVNFVLLSGKLGTVKEFKTKDKLNIRFSLALKDESNSELPGWVPRYNGKPGSERTSWANLVLWDAREDDVEWLAHQKENSADVIVLAVLDGDTDEGQLRPRVYEGKASFQFRCIRLIKQSDAEVILIGFLGKDPQMQYDEEGQARTKFSLAESVVVWKNGKNKCPKNWQPFEIDGKVAGWKKTRWWNLTAWGGTAEAINNYQGKGDRVLVFVNLSGVVDEKGVETPYAYIDDDTGEPRAMWTGNCRRIEFLKKANGNGNGNAEALAEGFSKDPLPF